MNIDEVKVIVAKRLEIISHAIHFTSEPTTTVLCIWREELENIQKLLEEKKQVEQRRIQEKI